MQEQVCNTAQEQQCCTAQQQKQETELEEHRSKKMAVSVVALKAGKAFPTRADSAPPPGGHSAKVATSLVALKENKVAPVGGWVRPMTSLVILMVVLLDPGRTREEVRLHCVNIVIYVPSGECIGDVFV